MAESRAPTQPSPDRVPLVQLASGILWPAFLTSGAGTVVLFTLFDPTLIMLCIGGPEVSRVGAYSVGFFALWALTALSSTLTWYFERPEPHHKPPPQP